MRLPQSWGMIAMRMPVLLAAATLASASFASTANAAIVTYGIDYERTSVVFDSRLGFSPAPTVGRPGGTFMFDTTTNQLLSFDVRPGYPVGPVDYNAQVLSLFAAAGPCDLACFIGAVDGQAWRTYAPGGFQGGVFTELTFGTPLNGTAQLGTPAADTRYSFTVSGVARVTGAVPEPGTWAMMLLGFGSIGWAMRWARVRTSRVSYGVLPA